MLNRVMIIGNLGKDPEAKTTKGGVSISNFALATTERWKGQDGQMQEQTEWHRVVAWKQLADICNEYLRKGSKVYIEGKLQTRKWQDSDGNDRYTTEIIARDMKMLTPRGESGGGSGSYDQGTGSAGGGYDDSFSDGQAGRGGTGSDVPF